MKNEICKIEDIDDDKAPAIYVEGGLTPYLEAVKAEVAGQVADLSTVKGRKEIASLAAKVSKSKAAVEKCGRAYLKKLKSQPKVVELELRMFVAAMDALRDETRKPLSDWDEEQARIKADKEAKARADELEAKVLIDHEIGLLLHDKWLSDAKALEDEAEANRLEYEQKLKDDAAAAAIVAKEEAERELAKRIVMQAEAEAKAVSDAKIAEAKAIANAIAAAAKAEANAKAAAAKAVKDEADRQAKVAARVKRDREDMETSRANIGKVRGEVKADLMSLSIPEELAKEIVLAICKGKVRNVSVQYWS